MKNPLLLVFWLLAFSVSAQVTVSPETFDVDTQITITVDINSSATNCNSISNPGKVYMHSGIGDDTSPWGYKVIGNWGKDDGIGAMTNNNDGTWSITLTPKSYFSLTTEQAQNASKIGLVFRNADGTQELKASDCNDFFLDIGQFQLNITSPSTDPVIINSGETLNITASSSLEATFSLEANNSIVNTTTVPSTDYSFSYVINENTNFVLTAISNGESISRNFKAYVRPVPVEEAVPSGMLEGINYDPLDNTRVTLVLYAPEKEFVHVIGDFNNWEPGNTWLMKKDSSKDMFWIELTGLTPQTDHMYQYLVDYKINIADPYSTTILDEYNDQYINNTTYPSLPAYPASSTTEAVTLLRTGDPGFAWNTTNYQKPSKEDLVIYELLIRDFDALHSFNAVRSRLDYLQNLGINAIELMPVSEFDGNESWGYNPSFHMALDKYYGTADAFKMFIDACHSRGIAVIMDVVYNHATGQNPYFRLWNDSEGGVSGSPTANNPFFNQSATHSYSVFNDFNHQSDATRRYVERTVKYWIEEYHIDGFRWDLTKGFTQNCTNDEACTNAYNQDRVDVLKQYADYQWDADPDFYVIFEHLGIGGSADEEKEWSDYRLNEGKGIMLWNNLNAKYNEATMGYNSSGNSDFSNISYINKGFEVPANISYMESHDEERLMYKNTAYGNSDGNYNIKTLSTGLQRMQLAGAFFFTVPGPKMIWQFGELGYDYSIEYNGRTGSKPIKWEYFDEPERKAIYDLWTNLIQLKLKEPIFSTDAFQLELNASNGLKTIHLTDTDAITGQIKYVTIIGNFGVTEQNIDPSFQETGVWYEFLNENLKYTVTDVNKNISLQPGEFRIFGNNPTSLFPNNNPPDQDSDGVVDADDQCPDTPLGATVDVNGCEIFILPATNFRVLATAETCRNSDNGMIEVIVEQLMTYNVNVTSTGFSHTDTFSTSNWSLKGLKAGSYEVCFTVAGIDDYEQCFDLNITEPEDLSVLSKVDTESGSVTLNMYGGETYYITLNENTIETVDDQISLDLRPGNNILSVSTNLECQGSYTETLSLPTTLLYYPNPVKEQLNLNLYAGEGKLALSIFDLKGRLLRKTEIAAPKNQRPSIPLNDLDPGMYILLLEGEHYTNTFKIIKQ